jgi:hypothetical protein
MRLQFNMKRLIFGAIAGLLGGLAMELYWRFATTLIGKDPRSAEKTEPTPENLRSLDSISLVGKQYQEGESSQAAVGRLVYETFTGEAPSAETKSLLEKAVIFGFSVGMSAAYSAVRDPGDNPDVVGGALLGTGAWLGGDELGMPLAGFAEGPTSYPLSLHLHSWAAHVAYGVVAALISQALDQLTRD